mgnify:CR=1 FL=1
MIRLAPEPEGHDWMPHPDVRGVVCCTCLPTYWVSRERLASGSYLGYPHQNVARADRAERKETA